MQNVLRTLVGESVAISLGDLATNTFAPTGLVDAAVNIVGDESSGMLKDSPKLKPFTGGDAISMEAKFKMAYAAVPDVKPFFSLNQLPRITDFSNGFLGSHSLWNFHTCSPQILHWSSRWWTHRL